MRTSITALVGIFIATTAAAEEPDVEARLEEAAAAGAAVERVLVERQPVRAPGCQGADCGAAGMKTGRTMETPDVPSKPVVAGDVAAKTNESAVEMGGMAGMGKMRQRGMGKMGGMGAMKESETGASMSTPAASAETPAASNPNEDPVAETADLSENESSGKMKEMGMGMGKMQRGGMGKMGMGGMRGGMGQTGETPTQPEGSVADADPSTP